MKLFNAISLGLVMIFASSASTGINNALRADSTSENEVKQNCDKALEATYLNIDTAHVVSYIRLPYAGIYSSTITWTSNKEEVIAIDSVISGGKVSKMIGKVTRPEADTDVTLTATASIISAGTTYSSTKDFYLTVLKASEGTQEELPLAFNEDFSSYLTDIDLSNYNKWQLSKGENGVAQVIHSDELPNINNMVSPSALQVSSKKMNNDTCYDAIINVKAPATGSTSAVLEGYMMFADNTNGVAIELCSNSTVVTGFSMSSDSFNYYQAGKYVSAKSTLPTEGVWQKFRVVFRTSGYLIFQVYSWEQAKYIDVTKESTNYVNGGGVASGAKGSINKLRIRAVSGKKVGTTYISNLKLDTVANLPESAEVANPNREFGIGNITGYEPSILALKGTTVSGIDPKQFNVFNRFDASSQYTIDTDYSVNTVVNKNEDESVVTYKHTFTLLKSMAGVNVNESKTITQTVYFDEASNVANISGFKVSYLKKAYNEEGVFTNAYSTISGNVIRDDSTLYYAVLNQGSAEPTQSQIVEGINMTGLVDHGSKALNTSSFSIDTGALDINKFYDVYVVTKNVTGTSSIYSSKSVSTKVNISTCEDLYQITNDKDTSASECVLLNDIDFGNYEWAYDTGALKFAGILDGNGHTISNLSISTPDAALKVGLFAIFAGTCRNLTFDNAFVAGFTDVGVLAGNLSDNANITNVNFNTCRVEQEQSVSGGDGYFGVVGGRVRSGANVKVENVNIKDNTIDCSQRTGLVTGGVGDSNDSAVLSMKNVLATGTINTQNGASVGGLVGRNRGDITVENSVVFLNVLDAKKEVAAVVGKHEKGTLNVKNLVGDLKVEQITQSNYFNQFIGTVTPTQATYKAENVTFINEDYSNLGDSIAYNVNAIDLGNHVNRPSSFTQRWWEENTFFRNFDTSTEWRLGSDGIPEVSIRKASDIAFTADDFVKMVGLIDESKILDNHYYIYKAYDIYNLLSSTEKAKVTTEYAKLNQIKAKYDAAYDAVNSIIGDLLSPVGSHK